MIKKIAIGAVIGAAALASPAHADGFYLNPEFNGGLDNDFQYGGGVLEGHLGYEKGAFYIQGGPAIAAPDGADSYTGITGKTGLSRSFTENLSLYGELSFAKFEDLDANYGVKAGAKYSF